MIYQLWHESRDNWICGRLNDTTGEVNILHNRDIEQSHQHHAKTSYNRLSRYLWTRQSKLPALNLSWPIKPLYDDLYYRPLTR
ncbi:MAG: hypothetical protein ACI9T7_001858 [Oleiphilaceae bacterium]|jgi:hypothetical protein